MEARHKTNKVMNQSNFLKKLKSYLKSYLAPLSLNFKNRVKSKKNILYKWYKEEKCAMSPPLIVKQAILLRQGIPESTWVETGTHLGETTKFLANNFKAVHTIEPSELYLDIAKKYIGKKNNVSYHLGTSEECFSDVLEVISGNISFWLDGHFSGGDTFLGEFETPIKYELDLISKMKDKYKSITIFIDDLDCCYQKPEIYPSIDFYISWAKSNKLIWTIENNIFIAKSNYLSLV